MKVLRKSPVDFSNLSIVLQGPTVLGKSHVAETAARSARQCFPGAEIIVSCWHSDKTEAVRPYVDRLITSADPGPQHFSGKQLNVNRQVVSSKTGIDAATRPFVLKARSDLVFQNARIWTEFARHQNRFQTEFGHDPILITNLTSVNPKLYPRYFALCDWVYLGRIDSISALFSTPKFPDSYLNYVANGQPNTRYNAEQWIALNYLARHGLDLDLCPDGYATGPAIASAHEKFVGAHFALSSWFRLGIRTQKHRISSFSLNRMYTNQEWMDAFVGRSFGFDFERLAISVAHHPTVRKIAKRVLRHD